MKYRSTRGGVQDASFQTVVMEGLASDGGLFVPSTIPKVSSETLQQWSSLSFDELATEVLSLFSEESELPRSDLAALTKKSFSTFSHPDVTPVVKVSDSLYILELFHGPTFAFKDVALQFLGNLFEYFLERNSQLKAQGLTVLGATSGDTGSAAIYGLRGKANIEIFVLHPRGRVSRVQELQMTTVPELNVHNIAVEGTFDDCQNIVKELFNDETFRKQYNLSAINSINWARIAAQTVYYFHAYNLLRRSHGDDIKLQFAVPTGNFGDVLAGYYAREMGLPINNLVVAVNKNDILARFFRSGRYERLKEVEPSLSPAMDIQISSNFERYLFHLCGDNTKQLAEWMEQFKTKGLLTVTDPQLIQANSKFLSISVTDEETLDAIGRYHAQSNRYDLCPHTAVGVVAAERLLLPHKDEENVINVCLATAHPAKFADAFLKATNGEGPVVPEAISLLANLPQRCLQIDAVSSKLVKDLVEGVVKQRK